MSVTVPIPTDPFRTVRRFAGAQLIFATICASLFHFSWLLRGATSSRDTAFALIPLAALIVSSAALPFALPPSRAEQEYGRLQYVLGAGALAYLAALSLEVLVMPLVEAVGSMLGSGAGRRPEAPWRMLTASLLIWTLQFLRPWRAPWARVGRLLVAGFVVAWSVLTGRIGLLSLPDAGETALALFVFALTMAVIRLCDAIWSGFAGRGVPDAVSPLRNTDQKMPDYAGQGEKTVGVALSGGGYRASLFALGALMYVRDATAAAPPRRVVAVCSVSGGSVTNAVVAHAGGLDAQDFSAFDRATAELLRHATGSGSMFKGLAARLYYIGLLPATLATFIWLVWAGLPQIPIATLARAACIVAIPVVLIAAYRFVVTRLSLDSDWDAVLGLVLLAMLVGLAGVAVVLPEWRRGLALIAAALAAIGGSIYVWSLRGSILELTIETALRRVTGTTGLSNMRGAAHHILCATEVQQDETAYFAQDAITVPSLGRFAPDALPTARAVRASAAFPVVFPPYCCGRSQIVASATSSRGRVFCGGWIRAEHRPGPRRAISFSSTAACGIISPSTGSSRRTRRRPTSWWSSAPRRIVIRAAAWRGCQGSPKC